MRSLQWVKLCFPQRRFWPLVKPPRAKPGVPAVAPGLGAAALALADGDPAVEDDGGIVDLEVDEACPGDAGSDHEPPGDGPVHPGADLDVILGELLDQEEIEENIEHAPVAKVKPRMRPPRAEPAPPPKASGGGAPPPPPPPPGPVAPVAKGKAKAKASPVMPLGPKATVLRYPVEKYGCIAIDEVRGFLNAECACPGHDKCAMNRTYKLESYMRDNARGRPLGLLVAWLRQGDGKSAAEHRRMKHQVDVSYENRVKAREWVVGDGRTHMDKPLLCERKPGVPDSFEARIVK